MLVQTRSRQIELALIALLPIGLSCEACGDQASPTRPTPQEIVVIRPDGGWTELGSGLSVSVKVVGYVGPTAIVLWRNHSLEPASIRIEAPLGVSDADKSRLKRVKGTICMGNDGPKLEGVFEAGWNLSSLTVPPSGWDFSYLSGFIAEDRSCIVSLRIHRSGSSGDSVKHMLIDAAVYDDNESFPAKSNGDDSELIVSAKSGSMIRVSDLHVSGRLDLLVENWSTKRKQVSAELVEVKCDGKWHPIHATSRDSIVAITQERKRLPIEPSSWGIFSFFLTGIDDWPGPGGCVTKVSVSEFGLDGQLAKTISVETKF